MRAIGNHVPSGWYIRSKFAYNGKIENPLKLYQGEDCVKKFCDHVIGEVVAFINHFQKNP